MNQPTTDFSALERAKRTDHDVVIWQELQNRQTDAVATGDERPAMFLLVANSCPSAATFATRHFAGVQMGRPVHRVEIAVSQRPGIVDVRSGGIGQRGRIAKGWRKPTSRTTREEFVREREYVGHVGDIDWEHERFIAVLGSRADDLEEDLVATFSFRILDTKQVEQLASGVVFSLVTGYRRTIDQSGRVLKTASESRIFLREPRRLSSARREQAHRLADRLFENG